MADCWIQSASPIRHPPSPVWNLYVQSATAIVDSGCIAGKIVSNRSRQRPPISGTASRFFFNPPPGLDPARSICFRNIAEPCTIPLMFTSTIPLFFLLTAPLQETKPIIDNNRVTVHEVRIPALSERKGNPLTIGPRGEDVVAIDLD